MKKLFIFIITSNFIITHAQDHLSNQHQLINIKEAQHNIVLLNNNNASLPIKELQTLKIASVHFNYLQSNVFDSIAKKYWAIEDFKGDTIQSNKGFYELHDKLKLYNLILLTLSSQTTFTPALIDFIKDIEKNTKTVVIVSGNGNNLRYLNKIKSPVVWSKTENSETSSVAAQVIFGGRPITNVLDTDYGGSFKKGSGFKTVKTRLAYSVPEEVAINSDLFAGVDSIVNAGIEAHSAPAVVILVAKDGKVIFNKAYGHHTYNGPEQTRLDDIFDMASVTKVTATTPSVMRLYNRKLISLDSPISKYVALTRSIPDKNYIKIKEALLHEAGYTPYIKFFEKLQPSDMSTDSSASYPTKVADNYYLRANYFNEVMWPVTLHSKVETRGQYVYSDISMYMMKEVVEAVSHQKLNDYVLNEFYLPLGMQSSGFLPRNRFNKSRIIPTTENDNWFRNMLVQGYVNDPGSAMAGGVEGHAGLFSNANDLAIYYQMLLNEGTYGGQKYFDPATVKLFTSRQSKVSGRGYGFLRVTDKEAQANKLYPSQQAFGHTGYTGTHVWVDPKFNLVYICLTNRVYPDDNKTYGISKVNIRTLVLDLVYKIVSGKNVTSDK